MPLKLLRAQPNISINTRIDYRLFLFPVKVDIYRHGCNIVACLEYQEVESTAHSSMIIIEVDFTSIQ